MKSIAWAIVVVGLIHVDQTSFGEPEQKTLAVITILSMVGFLLSLIP